MRDRFSQEMPWEDDKTIDILDHNGDKLIIDDEYLEINGEYVHEYEVLEYVKNTFRKVVVTESLTN